MRFLVTGGAGFIGSHLVRRLAEIESKYLLRVFDNLSSGSMSNLGSVRGKIEFVHEDVRNLAALREAIQGVDVVFHLAALTSVPGSVKDPIACNDVNANGTLNVLMAARDAGVKKVIFSSTSAIYGENPESPKKETLNPDPLSPYAASKLAGENYCRIFSRLYGLDTVSFRYFNVYGPRQDPNSQYAAVIPKFADALRAGRSPRVFGDGEQTRDFVSVRDVVEANIRAALRDVPGGSIFNVGTGRSVSLNQLLYRISRIINRDPKPNYEASVPGDIRHSLADISHMREVLGFAPSVSIEEGLPETIEWFMSGASEIGAAS